MSKNKVLQSRVFGLIGINAFMSNWNADFTKYPKMTSDGVIFASDKALKYTMKYLWDNQGLTILNKKSLMFKENKKGEIHLLPRTLRQRYEQLFDCTNIKKESNIPQVVKNLFSCVDVKQFGATFAEEGKNISITGAVQIGQGYNVYIDTEVLETKILSPFVNPGGSGKDINMAADQKKNTTIGTKIITDEAHYVYPFSIDPNMYKEYRELGIIDGYLEEDYVEFKRAALCCASGFRTNAKSNCNNEFAVFVETEPNLLLPALDKLITFTKYESDKPTYILDCNMLDKLGDRIKSIEVYYNPNFVNFKVNSDLASLFNIVTKEKIIL